MNGERLRYTDEDLSAALARQRRELIEQLRVSRVLEENPSGDYISVPIVRVLLSGEGFDVIIGARSKQEPKP